MASEADFEARYRHHKSRHFTYKSKYLRERLLLRLWLCASLLLLGIVSVIAINLNLSKREVESQISELSLHNSRLRSALNGRDRTIRYLESRPTTSAPPRFNQATIEVRSDLPTLDD